MIRLLLIDDQAVVREGIAAILGTEASFAVVGEAGTCAEARRLFAQHRPDVVLTEIPLADGNGIDLVREVREADPAARFVVLTRHHGWLSAQRAREAGARGFVTKSASAETLLDAIRQVHAGRLCFPDDDASPVPCPLTPREIEVLRFVVKGYTDREIGQILACSVNTAKTHVRHILEKLNSSNRAEATSAALEAGMLW